MTERLNQYLGDFKIGQLFSDQQNVNPYTLAVFQNKTKQLLFGADANIDPITGSLCLDNGMYRGLHRQYWDLRDEKQCGEHGGHFPAGKWVPRKFTVMDGVSGMGVSLNSDNTTIILEPGRYHIEAEAPALGVGDHQCRFFNLTKQITEQYGTNACSSSDENATTTRLSFSLDVAKSPHMYQLQHHCSGGRPGDGFGKATGFKDGMEVYSQLKIHRTN